MSKANRFNILNMSDNSDDDDNIVKENIFVSEDEVIKVCEIESICDASIDSFSEVLSEKIERIPDEVFIEKYDLVSGEYIKRKMTDEEKYNSVDYIFESPHLDYPSIILQKDNIVYSTKLYGITLDIIEKFQKEPTPRQPINFAKWHRCLEVCCFSDDSCYDCDKEERNPELFTKAWRRLMNLIQRNSDDTPVQDLKLRYAYDLTEFFPQIPGQRCEKFKTHEIIRHESEGMIANLHSWLSFNTGMKTINPRTGLEENLKLFVGSYDVHETGHDLCMNDDTIDRLDRFSMAPLRRDLYVLKQYKDSERVRLMIANTERRMRIVYNNYLILLAPRFKFFVSFDQARLYIKRHFCSIQRK